MEPQKKLRSVLAPYLLENAEVGDEISRGIQDSLVKVKYYGVDCHGKKLNLLDFRTEKKKNDDMATRLRRECDLLATLRHPNLVQFIGVVFSRADAIPILVSEVFPVSVASIFDFHTRLPLSVQVSILKDVAQGLMYLHSIQKPVVHGDITARSIFLTRGLQAKIANLGVARLFDPSTVKITVTMTKSPETAAYSPPEALNRSSSLTPSVDIFSYGVLTLHIACGACPIPTTNLQQPGASELDKRRKYVDSMKDGHHFSPLIQECLSNDPKSRPSSVKLLERIQEISKSNPLPYETALELIQRMERRESELLTMVERLEIEQKEVAGIGKQLNTYDEQLTAVKEQMKTMEQELANNLKEIPFDQALNKILRPQKDTSKNTMKVSRSTSAMQMSGIYKNC